MKHYDLIVVGGGFTGVAASIAAAREGLSVLLAESGGALGGAAVHCLVNPFMPYATTTEDGERLELSRGIFSEIVRRLEDLGQIRNKFNFHEEYLKWILDQMTQEAGVEVLFHVTLAGVRKEDRKIRSLTFIGSSAIGAAGSYSHSCYWLNAIFIFK